MARIHDSTNEIAPNHWPAGAVKEDCQPCIVFLLPIVNIHAAWNFSVRILTWGGGPRPLVPPDHGCDGETVSPSPQSHSGGPNTLILRHSRLDARIVAATLRQHSPSDPRQLIGERRCQNAMMQA